MRIAIVGSGVSGLVTARLLAKHFDVTVFEADRRIGGHVNTIKTECDGSPVTVDTGFIVFNDRTYPNFCRVLRHLKIESAPTEMSFSVRCERSGLEYSGSSLNGLFAQRRNLLRPSFLRMLRDILQFNREGPLDLNSVPEDQTVGQYLSDKRFSRQFAQHYLLPMGAAIWSCPYSDFEQFPIRFILEFYVNHGLLSLRDRPQWRVIKGGSFEYVRRLVAPFKDRIRLNCPVHRVSRSDIGVQVEHAHGQEQFDELVFACHSDQALRMLSDADEVERELLSAFPYRSSTAVLHTDESLLPIQRRAWSAWNYRVPQEPSARPTLTYNMSLLQHINAPKTFCVTLNEDERIADDKKIASFRYSHPLFTTRRFEVQRRHNEVIRRRRTSYCGAYWRNGFHEDGVISALAVCNRFGISDWSMAESYKTTHVPIQEKPVLHARAQQ